jgi:hypothetical protein
LFLMGKFFPVVYALLVRSRGGYRVDKKDA